MSCDVTLVAQRSATCDSVAATPLCSAIRFAWKSIRDASKLVARSETSKRHLKGQQPQSDAKSDAKFAAIVQFLTCHFTVVAFRGRCTILQKSSFHGCWLTIVVVWRSLWLQQLPLNDGQVENFRGPRMGGWICRGWFSRFWGAPIFSSEVPKCLF